MAGLRAVADGKTEAVGTLRLCLVCCANSYQISRPKMAPWLRTCGALRCVRLICLVFLLSCERREIGRANPHRLLNRRVEGQPVHGPSEGPYVATPLPAAV